MTEKPTACAPADDTAGDSQTTEAALYESRELHAKLMATIPDAVIRTDLGGTIQFANEMALQIGGYTLSDLVGRNMLSFIAPEDRDRAVANTMRMFDGPLGPREYMMVTKDGTLMPFEVNGEVLYHSSGDPFGMVYVCRDITERKRTERQLRRLNADLERRVRERTAELEVVSRHKTEFLTNVSHEIRTPMSGIIGACELALSTTHEAGIRDYLGMIHRSARDLMVLVNDILDFSRIEAGELKFDPCGFSLCDSVEGLYDVFYERVQEQDVEFAVNIADGVQDDLVGDPQRLRQVLINLIGNAFKFTDRGEIILDISQIGGETGKATVRFAVRDTGVGIEAELLPGIFDAFVQGGDAAHRHRCAGSGLGLAISKRIIELMGGRIQVESRPGAGSTFSFTVPFDLQTECSAAPAGDRQPRRLSGLKVMVVDDHLAARESIASLVESFGCSVSQVDSGAAALNRLPADSAPEIDLLLIDHRLGDMTGTALAEAVQRRYGSKAPKMAAVSGYTAEIDAEAARRSGLAKVIGKPVKREQLFDELAALFPDSKTFVSVPPAASLVEPCFDFSGKRVLLVEDNAINQRVAAAVCASVNLSVTTVNNGAEALAALEGGRFDAVLMDIQMPVMDGFEATGEIRRLGGLDDLPVVAMTAHATTDCEAQCREAGMNGFITKPIDRQQLFEVLARLMTR